MPNYLPPHKTEGCICAGEAPIAPMLCPYGHPTECHYPMNCAVAGCGHLEKNDIPTEKILEYREAANARIRNAASPNCPTCRGVGLRPSADHPPTFLIVCNCVRIDSMAAYTAQVWFPIRYLASTREFAPIEHKEGDELCDCNTCFAKLLRRIIKKLGVTPAQFAIILNTPEEKVHQALNSTPIPPHRQN